MLGETLLHGNFERLGIKFSWIVFCKGNDFLFESILTGCATLGKFSGFECRLVHSLWPRFEHTNLELKVSYPYLKTTFLRKMLENFQIFVLNKKFYRLV